MIRIFCFALIALSLGAAARSDGSTDAPQVSAPERADLIMINAHINTPEGWQQALALRNGIIVALGDNEEVMQAKGENSEVLDLGGKAVFPGLHDMHVHPMFAGQEMFACRLNPGANATSVRKSVTECVNKAKSGEWVIGGNWVANAFSPGEQNRALLDDIAPENPVVMMDEAHHSIWVNSLALSLAGITRDTPNPKGGIIERGQDGEPNGLLREDAARLVERLLPPASEEAKREAVILATNIMSSFGITSFIVASVRPHNIQTFAELSAEGVMKQRVRGCIVWEPADGTDYNISERLIEARAHYTRARFRLDCVKIFVDGVPTESHTAAMLSPYVDGGDVSRPEKGLLLVEQNALNSSVTRFDQQGLHIKFHAAGDGAVRAAIDAVAAARAENGSGGPIHAVGHNSFVDMVDIPRVRDLDMAWEFSPYIWYPTGITSDILAAVGEQRMERFIPIRDAVDTGALVVVGSDWSVVPSVNPWLAIETMVTREVPGGGERELSSQEAVSLEEAFAIMTRNGARLMGHSDRVGTLQIGMLADLIVTETNPFREPIETVHDTRVLMTFIEGEKVFDAASPPRLKAR
jgi:predicted amidohydrolase YtcJ